MTNDILCFRVLISFSRPIYRSWWVAEKSPPYYMHLVVLYQESSNSEGGRRVPPQCRTNRSRDGIEFWIGTNCGGHTLSVYVTSHQSSRTSIAMEELQNAFSSVVGQLSDQNYAHSTTFYYLWFDIGQTYLKPPLTRSPILSGTAEGMVR